MYSEKQHSNTWGYGLKKKELNNYNYGINLTQNRTVEIVLNTGY